MTALTLATPYSLKRVEDMLGLPRTTVYRLIAKGFVVPTRGPGNQYHFSFQDLMPLRTAASLQEARVPPRRIFRSLARLKADLPAQMPLTGLRITAVGADVVVRDRAGAWQADTGQLLMDFEVESTDETVAFIAAGQRSPAKDTDWFREGVRLEGLDPAAAAQAYRRAIAQEPARADAYLNLGAMLCEAARCAEAVELFQRATTLIDDDALLQFNLAIALDDEGRSAHALQAYQQALRIDPALADAHYNLGLLLDAAGDAQGALRHLNAYRRLQAAPEAT